MPVAVVEGNEVYGVRGLVVVVASLCEPPLHRPQGTAVHKSAELISRVLLGQQRYVHVIAQVLSLVLSPAYSQSTS